MQDGTILMVFRTMGGDRKFNATITALDLADQGVSPDDLRLAPSFAVRKYPSYRLLEFISDRKKRIDLIRLPKVQA
ncbi:hypothetical protein CO655_07705 [Rhizobium sp. M1]|nr:hypothetical protein CO655_07705 [Rhizobium sp. M1]